jgi:hypothetical protein
MEKLERTLSKIAIMELEKHKKERQLERLERTTFNAMQRDREQKDEMNTAFNKGNIFIRQNYDQRNNNYRQQPYRFDGSVRTNWTYRGNRNF